MSDAKLIGDGFVELFLSVPEGAVSLTLRMSVPAANALLDEPDGLRATWDLSPLVSPPVQFGIRAGTAPESPSMELTVTAVRKPSIYEKLAERHGWYAVWNGVHWLHCAKTFERARLDLNRAHAVRHGGLTIEAATAMGPNGECCESRLENDGYCAQDAVVCVPRKLIPKPIRLCLNCYERDRDVVVAGG